MVLTIPAILATFNTAIVSRKPWTPKSRMWLFARLTRPMGAADSALARSGDTLKKGNEAFFFAFRPSTVVSGVSRFANATCALLR